MAERMRESRSRQLAPSPIVSRRVAYPRILPPDEVTWLGMDGRTWARSTLTKDEAECCNARRDDLGRMSLGYCSPECVRRPRRQ